MILPDPEAPDLDAPASPIPQTVRKTGPWIQLSSEALADFGMLDWQRDVMQRVYSPWMYPDRPAWPTFVPCPRLAAFSDAIRERRRRVRVAWLALRGHDIYDDAIYDEASDW